MALLNFKKRFAPLVESGTKTHTIRAWRKHPIREGEMLHLYTGLRQKGARLLGRWPCTKAQTITIEARENSAPFLWICVDGRWLNDDEVFNLLRRDGFAGGPAEAYEFWKDRLPINGQLIHWDPAALEAK